MSYSAIESVSSCAPPPPPDRLAAVYYRDAHIHTAKILRSIEKLTDLLTLPTRMAMHTPFTICMVATMTIAHLSACKHVLQGEALKVARERIRVAMGALEIFAEVWPRGRKVVREVKTIARELLSLGLSPGVEKPIENMKSQGWISPRTPSDSMLMQQDYLAGSESGGYFDFSTQIPYLESGLGSGDLNLRNCFPYNVTV
jgi:hypothetical protein